MHISARGDYAVQAMLVIAAASGHDEPIRALTLADDQRIPFSFLQSILLDLVRARLLHSYRGIRGGYRLARPAAAISVGDILRAVGGELTSVRGAPASKASYTGAASGLQPFWLALTSGVTHILDTTTLAELHTG
jgi:Rrf2 family protein